MDTNFLNDRCSVCGAPFEDTGKKQQCRNCGMFANLCCDPQMPIKGYTDDEAGQQEHPSTDGESVMGQPRRRVQ